MLDLAKQLIEQGFNALGDVLKNITIKELDTQTYNVNTGTNTVNYNSHVVLAHIANFNKKEIDNSNVLATDRKIMFLTRTQPTLKLADKITLAGIDYQIISIRQDPTATIWTAQCRA
jgi:hypothetical protein